MERDCPEKGMTIHVGRNTDGQLNIDSHIEQSGARINRIRPDGRQVRRGGGAEEPIYNDELINVQVSESETISKKLVTQKTSRPLLVGKPVRIGSARIWRFPRAPNLRVSMTQKGGANNLGKSSTAEI